MQSVIFPPFVIILTRKKTKNVDHDNFISFLRVDAPNYTILEKHPHQNKHGGGSDFGVL